MSIWNKNEKKRTINTLDKNIEVDTLIIGAGMTGLTIAYYLKNYPSICVVESGLYGHGVTLNTTAKITYLQETVYTSIKSLSGKQDAKSYLKSQKDAIQYIIDIIKKEKINCDFIKIPSYLFASTKKQIKSIKKEVTFLKENGILIKKGKLPNKINSYVTYYVDDTYTFHPLKYLNSIFQILKKNNIPIYENTTITKIRKKDNIYFCYTDKYCIKAKKVILACHYPFFLFPTLLPIKTSIEKSYITISKVEKDYGYTCINASFPTYSCRFYNDKNDIYQISLAESHNIAIKQNDIYHLKKLKEIFNLKEENIIMNYSNTDIITSDRLPYIGKIKSNMYIATGYNTWGMTNSILAAKIISDIFLKGKNEYIELFNPKRIKLISIIKIPYYLANQIKSYVGSKINKNKFWYSKKITFKIKNGKNIAIYKDNHDKDHIIYNQCPHMGCSLIFNEKEKTWDCPCHSSRFDIDGNCIKGPSTYSVKYVEDR